MSQTASFQLSLEARVGSLHLDLALDHGGGPLALVGPNGAGKTSLLGCLLGALPVTRGYVRVGEALLLDTEGGVDVPMEQRRFGFVPQRYALFPHLSVRANLDFALSSTHPRLSTKQRQERREAQLDALDLGPLQDRLPSSLSGGERQRVALARALCACPRALLLDEPLAALDLPSRARVRAFLGAYLRQLALPTLVVTHDPEDARALGSRIAVLEQGKLTQVGTWEELVAQPRSSFVEAFVGAGAQGREAVARKMG